MEAVTITQVSPFEFESIIEKILKKVLSESQSTTLQDDTACKLNKKEAAEYLGISEGTLRNRTNDGTIAAGRLGRRIVYDRKDLDAALSTIKTELAA